LLLLAMLSGCGFVGSGMPVADSCSGWRMILLRGGESPATEAEIIAHNEHGERRGCWKGH
jgi:hypothetical protein